MFDFFFEAFYFLSKINHLEEEKYVAMSYEVVHFLADGLFVDFISDLSRYFFWKDFFRIHLDQNQIIL